MGVMGAKSCNSGINENWGEGTIGGKTGGLSNVDLGTSGGVVKGTGLGDGIGRSCSPDVLRTSERTGDGGNTRLGGLSGGL